jgi:O-methyltransferase
MLRQIILAILRRKGYDLVKARYTVEGQPVLLKPLDVIGVELIGDPTFQASCAEVYDLTLLDTPRLANLWQLCRETDPAGNILEVGVYKGGSALHLSNSAPGRQVFACDSFTGFAALDERLDHAFDKKMFKDTSREAVEQRFASRNRKIEVIQGFFPASCASKDLGPISFVHLDVDIFEATRDSLNWLDGKLMKRSLIVIDDYSRTADGVNKAVKEFIDIHPGWMVLPLFPSQALLIPQTWFNTERLSKT